MLRSIPVAALLAASLAAAGYARDDNFDTTIPGAIDDSIHQFRSHTPIDGRQLSSIADWEQAKPRLIAAWRAGLARLPLTQEHLRFFDANRQRVLFGDPGPSKLGTYDFDRKAPLVNSELYEKMWRALISAGNPPDEAASLLAARSLPGFAHLLRDGIMRTEDQRLGLYIGVGFLEDEVIHWSEEHRVFAAVERENSSLYNNDWQHKQKLDPADEFDFEALQARESQSEGPAAVIRLVADTYNMQSLLCRSKPDWLKENDPTDAANAIRVYETYRAGIEPEMKAPFMLDDSLFEPKGWTAPAVNPAPGCQWTYVQPSTVDVWRKRVAERRSIWKFLNDGHFDRLAERRKTQLAAYGITPDVLCATLKQYKDQKADEARFNAMMSRSRRSSSSHGLDLPSISTFSDAFGDDMDKYDEAQRRCRASPTK